ncbi:MAG: hypothetical protein L0241_31920 [Planctomycetia bacterium]|nr:hypothetical protein [Planctomycetia bacterium]
MVCEHLAALERELIAQGLPVTYRGRAWGENCREWVYFSCVLDLKALRARLGLPDCVEDHMHKGTHDGSEAGFYCSTCQDGVMGYHPKDAGNARTVS